MTISDLKFDAPGPGVWEADTAHYTRPVSHFLREPMLLGFPRGFAKSTARYGALLDHFQPAIVHGFYYHQAVAFGAPKGAKGPPPKIILQLLTRLHPKMRARIKASKEAIEQKLWREDLRNWDEVVKPRSLVRHAKMRAVDPATLSLDALKTHLSDCSKYLEDMIEQHHIFTVTATLPVGDFLAHVSAWTGKQGAEILDSLRGSSPVSNGVAAAELDALVDSIKREPEALTKLNSSTEPGAILRSLMDSPGAVGVAARAYLDVVGFRSTGYDVCERYGWEMPGVLVRSIQAGLNPASSTTKHDATKARIKALRDAVPEPHRTQFDELLEEARVINRLRDERGVFSDGSAGGIVRRAILEAGARLVNAGRLHDVESAVDASCDELLALLDGATSPTADEIAKRTDFRRTYTIQDIPQFLGGEPSAPPPAEWLPEAARRPARAVDAMLTALFVEKGKKVSATQITGIAVSPGVYEGTARLVGSPDEFSTIQQGDVLVTRSTSPYFNVVLPLLGAIVTDRGGALSHAAIVAREYGIPGVVGTRESTSMIPNGARVRVDGNTGAVTILS